MSKIYQVTGIGLNEKSLQLQETIFHNANGYIGVRGTLEEGVRSLCCRFRPCRLPQVLLLCSPNFRGATA